MNAYFAVSVVSHEDVVVDINCSHVFAEDGSGERHSAFIAKGM